MIDTICLITAPASTDYEDPEDALSWPIQALARAPKLGVLALASSLEQAGLRPLLLDLDDEYAQYLAEGNRGLEAFPDWVVPNILASGVRLFGFSSICGSYPITIRIAERLKRRDPHCGILLGGPQASIVDTQTLAAFPFVDFILRGEADLTLPLFVREWGGERRYPAVPGLTWRSPFGIQRNPEAPVIGNLDDLPLPAFHLCPGVKDSHYAYLELGRGCPFACTFCSTNDFFRRKFRVKSPARMLADMRLVASRYGFTEFNLVHDMFTVDRRKVVAFCQAMIEANEGFNWTCSARTDCVDRELLELMARAGCDGIFFGVETGSKRMQRIIDKDLDPSDSRAAVEIAESLGMEAAVSTIVGFPEETEDDLRQTLDTFMHAMRHPHSIPQVGLLAPLAGTPVYSQYKDQLFLGDLSSYVSYPGRSQSDSDRSLVRRYPEIFPNFYLLPTPSLDRPTLQELAEFLPMGRKKLRWLLVALHRRSGGILEVFHSWRRWRIMRRPELNGESLRHYYITDRSRRDFVAFLRERLAEFDDPAIDVLVSFEECLLRSVANAPIRPAGHLTSGKIHSTSIPVRAPGVRVFEFSWDIQNIIDSLKVEATPSPTQRPMYYRTSDSEDEIRLVEISELVGKSLLLCDGVHSVRELEACIGLLFDCPENVRSYAVRRLLKSLCNEGMIQIYRGATLAKIPFSASAPLPGMPSHAGPVSAQ